MKQYIKFPSEMEQSIKFPWETANTSNLPENTSNFQDKSAGRGSLKAFTGGGECFEQVVRSMRVDRHRECAIRAIQRKMRSFRTRGESA